MRKRKCLRAKQKECGQWLTENHVGTINLMSLNIINNFVSTHYRIDFYKVIVDSAFGLH